MLTGDKPHAHVPAPRRPQPAEPANNDSRARPIVVTDISSCIRAVNQPFCAVTGYGAGDLVAKPLSTLIALDGIGIPGKDLSQYLDKDDRWRGKATLTCVDGTDSVVEIAMSAVRHAHGAISHVVVSVLANERPPEPEVPTSYRFDTATGLPRWSMLRFNLDRDLREVQRDGGLLAVMLLGLDNLGSVNRTRGHQAGRQLLEMLAKRLRTALQGRGNVSRLSGDTFTISFSRLKEPGTVPRLAESLMRVVKQPFIFAAQEVVLDAHVGVAVCPEHGRDVDTLLRAAEVALGHAKTRGNGSFEFFSEELHQKECRRLAIESGLRRALKRGELELFYQARVDVRSTRICGAEALIRWRHPEWGLVSPSDFIPVAEETGLIVDIGQWVLWAAVRQFDTWRKQRLPIDHLSVNVTGHQLCRADFPQILHTALSHADLGGGSRRQPDVVQDRCPPGIVEPIALQLGGDVDAREERHPAGKGISPHQRDVAAQIVVGKRNPGRHAAVGKVALVIREVDDEGLKGQLIHSRVVGFQIGRRGLSAGPGDAAEGQDFNCIGVAGMGGSSRCMRTPAQQAGAQHDCTSPRSDGARRLVHVVPHKRPSARGHPCYAPTGSPFRQTTGKWGPALSMGCPTSREMNWRIT